MCSKTGTESHIRVCFVEYCFLWYLLSLSGLKYVSMRKRNPFGRLRGHFATTYVNQTVSIQNLPSF